MRIAFVYPQYLWLLLLIPLTAALALLGQRSLTRARFWTGLVLRALLLAAIVLALAGIQLRLPTDSLTAVFLLDVSDSIPPAEQSRGEDFIRSAVNEMPAGDKAAVVVFGQDALVERLASEERGLPGLASVPVTSRTDIAGALQLGLALFPDEGAKRLVLLSDGRENLSQALDQAELAAAHGIELLYLPLGEPQGEVEVLVDSLQAPADARQGQEFELTVLVQSTAETGATLRVFADDALLETRNVQLEVGANRFQVPVEAGERGFRRYRAQIAPDEDNRLQNNEGSAFTVVHGPPSVLLVEGEAGEGENLTRALQASEMDVRVISPAQLPTTLPELANWDSVILVNVPAYDLPEGAMEALPVYVRELGRGLLMTGGQNSFGAGGYLRTPIEEALPVHMDVRNREQAANLALVLAVDKSGSMGRCHCDNPDLNQTYTRAEVGQPKVDIAKEAVMRSAGALGDQDILGVVTFDSQARWALETGPLVDPAALEGSIGAFQAEGQTNVQSGVEAAYESLQGVDAKRKHVILLTDGWTQSGNVSELARQMQEEGITLSIVAAGGGSAEYLAELAETGGGRYYPAEDILSVPDIFLKETITSVGEYIIEGASYPLVGDPGPVLRGIDTTTLPALLGYNGTTPKNTARKDLYTSRGDTLLASWQYGLGRAAVWTSDLKGQWARDWLAWEGFPRFVAQLVGWTLPTPQVEGLSAQAGLVEGQAVVRLTAVDELDRPLNFLDASATIVDPDLGTREIPMAQVGAGQYEAQAEVLDPGTYLVRVGVMNEDEPVGTMLMGVVVPYSPEYRESGKNEGLLRELSRLTGAANGLILEPAAAFLHNLPAADFAREIWRPFLLLAALLFPLDVAIRRVMFSQEDYRKARVWLRERLPGRAGRAIGQQPRTVGQRTLGQLFQARERARQRRSETPAPAADNLTENIPPREPAPGGSAPEGAAPREKRPARRPSGSAGDSLSRLREAKKRARREE
jgi:Mg-chelatase subunit ChlD